MLEIPFIEGPSRTLWAAMLQALTYNKFCDPRSATSEDHDGRQYFMCYMRNVDLPKSVKWYKARKHLEDLNMIVRYKSSPSIYLINPEYHPWLRPIQRNAIIKEMKAIGLDFIQNERFKE